jgi:hypothetical protein
MAMFGMDNNDDAADRMAEMFGPGQIDHQIRQAIQWCWVGLPKERRTVKEVEAQIRRIVERALRDFREDREAFGRSGGS